MNNERYNQLIDEAYENYLKNFIEPTCPPNLDVQPSYYEPMTKDWFVKSAKERGSRGDEFSKKWGLKIEEREWSVKERLFFVNKSNEEYEKALANKTQYESIGLDFELALTSRMNELNIPTKLITVTYKDEKIEVYE